MPSDQPRVFKKVNISWVSVELEGFGPGGAVLVRTVGVHSEHGKSDTQKRTHCVLRGTQQMRKKEHMDKADMAERPHTENDAEHQTSTSKVGLPGIIFDSDHLENGEAGGKRGSDGIRRHER